MSKQARIEKSRQAKILVDSNRVTEEGDKKTTSAKVVYPFSKSAPEIAETEKVFGALRVGDTFRISRTASSPKEGVSPVFKKTEPVRFDASDQKSDVCNCFCTETFKKGWLPDLISVVEII